jgi:predicted NBD/HSP70 family sugar kinase
MRRADIHPGPDRRRTTSASTVLLAALDHGPVARSTIARLAGLSPAAVTQQCAGLIGAGLLREADQQDPGQQGPGQQGAQKGPGRPHVPVDVDTGGSVVCGLHIAVQRATLAAVDLRGRVIACEHHPHGDGRASQVLGRVAARVPGFLAQHVPGRRPLGLGIATGGWVDPGAGVIVEHPPLRWRDVPVRELLAQATGLPVRADSHARALIRAEQLFGDRRTRVSAVHMFVGSVVDAAFATGGTVHHGPRSAAGTVAHLPLRGRADPCGCGRTGCLAAAVSEETLARRAAARRIIAVPDFPALLEAARAGDRPALALLRERARLVASAAATLLDVLNPEVLVVAEAGAVHVPGCLEIMREEIGRRARSCPDPGSTVVATSFGPDVLPVSAAAVMLDAIYTSPLEPGSLSLAS